MGLFNSGNGADNAATADMEMRGAGPSTTDATEITGTHNTTGPRRRGGLVVMAPYVLELLLAIIILGLVGYAEHVYADTFLQSAYVPAIVAAVFTIVATLPLIFASTGRFPGTMSHPLSIAGVDLFFALFWLAIMAELAAYSDVSAPRDVSYYTGLEGGQAYTAYSGTLGRLKRAWACGAAAAALAGVEFVLFLAGAVLSVRPLYGDGHHHHHGGLSGGQNGHEELLNGGGKEPAFVGSPTRPPRPAEPLGDIRAADPSGGFTGHNMMDTTGTHGGLTGPNTMHSRDAPGGLTGSNMPHTLDPHAGSNAHDGALSGMGTTIPHGESTSHNGILGGTTTAGSHESPTGQNRVSAGAEYGNGLMLGDTERLTKANTWEERFGHDDLSSRPMTAGKEI